jgi:Zn-finger nucleic acid-binding protein
MIVVEHNRIELDYCHLCSGVWFDSQELELLIESLNAEGAQLVQKESLTPQKADVKERPRKCPVCGHRMDKAWLGREPRVLIDSCSNGHGLWFDGGELHQVIRQMQANSTGRQELLAFLGETFKADLTDKADKQ